MHMHEFLARSHLFHLRRSQLQCAPSLFSKNGKNQAIRLPNDMAYEGVGELEIACVGDTITLLPVRPDWLSFSDLPKADEDSCKSVQKSSVTKIDSRCDRITLDTCVCSFIMRERPESILQRLAAKLGRNNRIVISAVTYPEVRYGQIGKRFRLNTRRYSRLS